MSQQPSAVVLSATSAVYHTTWHFAGCLAACCDSTIAKNADQEALWG
jgi:hypothetical protein